MSMQTFSSTQFIDRITTTNLEHEDEYNTKWSTYASIIYFSSYTLLIIILSIHILKTENSDNAKEFIKAVWNRKSIYSQILVHVYDTATDIGVLVEWYILANDSIDYPSINMNAMFWASIGFQILYRLFSCFYSWFTRHSLFDALLGLLDMYIIKTVYQSLDEGFEEPSPRQKAIQLMESIFESLPQVVLQSVFIIKSWNFAIQDNRSFNLVVLSLAASLFSISNKFTWLDKDGVKDRAKEAELKMKWPCLNRWYVARIIWRFSFVATRFCMLSLIWTVLGGTFLPIYIAVSFIYWTVSAAIPIYQNEVDIRVSIIAGSGFAFASLISTPTSEKLTFCVIHVTEMVLIMVLITILAYNERVECGICTPAWERQANENGYIKMFIFAGWGIMIIDFIGYGILLSYKIFMDGALKFVMVSFGEGLREIREQKELEEERKKRKWQKWREQKKKEEMKQSQTTQQSRNDEHKTYSAQSPPMQSQPNNEDLPGSLKQHQYQPQYQYQHQHQHQHQHNLASPVGRYYKPSPPNANMLYNTASLNIPPPPPNPAVHPSPSPSLNIPPPPSNPAVHPSWPPHQIYGMNQAPPESTLYARYQQSTSNPAMISNRYTSSQPSSADQHYSVPNQVAYPPQNIHSYSSAPPIYNPNGFKQ